MALVFYGYPKCGTCRKAEKWLEDHDVLFDFIDISKQPPSKEKIAELHQKSGLPWKKLFNTSGRKYRELGLKDQLKSVAGDEWLEWLASDGMLLKRPIVTDGEKVTVGFHEDKFAETWGA